MSNIVFFGQADAGKSTLAGYLVSKFKEGFNILKFIDSMEREYPDFDRALTYSAIINTNKDEQRDLQRHNSTASHLRKVKLPFDDVTIIDTPGSERFYKQRERGMYYGNVGVFFMEIKNILDRKYKINTIAPIILWSKLKNKRIIFLLTKFDLVNYSEDAYKKAVEEVNYICQGDTNYHNISVIPIAIEVNKLRDLPRESIQYENLGENICDLSQKMPWYKGPCLLEAIKSDMEYLDKDDKKEVLSFCITDQVENPSNGIGKVWKIKILSGILKVGDNIILSPIKDSKTGMLYTLHATVKELREDISRFEEKAVVGIARKGNIYGLDINNCFIDKKRVKKSDFNAVASTCGFYEDAEYSLSEYFSFIVYGNDRNRFLVGRELRLIWFGRSLSFVVQDMKEDDADNNRTFILGQLNTTKIALPKDDANPTESIVIKGERNLDFINAKLVKIGKCELFSQQ